MTEIETVITEMKAIDEGARALAENLQELLLRYDTEATIALVEELPTVDGNGIPVRTSGNGLRAKLGGTRVQADL